jgi:hypothetical protein
MPEGFAVAFPPMIASALLNTDRASSATSAVDISAEE